MIEGIAQIGQILLQKDANYIELLILPLELDKKETFLIGINFIPDSCSVDFVILKRIPQRVESPEMRDVEQFDYEASRESTWVGNATGTSPQLRLTTNNIEYLLSQSIPLLRDNLPEGLELRQQLDEITKKFYLDLGGTVERRYRYILDITKTGIAPDIDLEAEINVRTPKQLLGLASSAVQRYIQEKTGISPKQVALYTVMLNGHVLAKSDEYKTFLKQNLQPEFDVSATGSCHVCNKEDLVSSNVTKLKFKYYIQDKLSFSSEITGDFSKSFSFCNPCYMKLQIGESFIQSNLQTNIGMFSVYLIPKFLFPIRMSPDELNKFANYISFSFNNAKNFQSITDFYNKLKYDYIYYEDNKNSFILNIMFYKRSKSEMKVLKLIRDVPPARLEELVKTTNRVGAIGRMTLNDSRLWEIDLEKIYYLIPVKRSKGDPTTYKELLDIYSSIISGVSISYRALIRQFLDLIAVYRFEKFPVYNIKPSGDVLWGMSVAIMQCNMFLLYLKFLNLLEGGVKMEEQGFEDVKLDEDIKEFITKMGYNEAQTALFLLGRLIGEIGWRQEGKEPILDKITYQGINPKRLLRLTNEVFEKLRQHRALNPYNKGIFSASKLLMDKHIQNWPLDDQENVFYILSGYSYRRQHVRDTESTELEQEEREEKEE